MKMLRTMTLTAALAIGLAAPALAQTSTAAPVSAAPPPAASTNEKLALAQQLVVATNAQGAMRRISDAMTSQFAKGFSSTSGEGDIGAFMAKVMNEEMDKLIVKTLPQFAQAYADTFDVQDLRDLLAFYNSPLGKRLVDKGPELSRRGQAIMQPYLPGLQAALIVKTFDHVCDVKGCSKEEREAMEAMKLKMVEQIKAQAAAANKDSI